MKKLVGILMLGSAFCLSAMQVARADEPQAPAKKEAKSPKRGSKAKDTKKTAGGADKTAPAPAPEEPAK